MSEFRHGAGTKNGAGVAPAGNTKVRRLFAALAALLAGAMIFAAGVAWSPQGATPAEVHRGPKREAFLSGSERSIPILEDIAATLHRIDTRLAHIEKLLEQSAAQSE